jgi:hypothetical protein
VGEYATYQFSILLGKFVQNHNKKGSESIATSRSKKGSFTFFKPTNGTPKKTAPIAPFTFFKPTNGTPKKTTPNQH